MSIPMRTPSKQPQVPFVDLAASKIAVAKDARRFSLGKKVRGKRGMRVKVPAPRWFVLPKAEPSKLAPRPIDIQITTR